MPAQISRHKQMSKLISGGKSDRPVTYRPIRVETATYCENDEKEAGDIFSLLINKYRRGKIIAPYHTELAVMNKIRKAEMIKSRKITRNIAVKS